MSEADDELGVDEEEVEVNAIETPRGRVPEFDSTFRALERISAHLIEQDEKIESLARRIAAQQSQREPSEIRELLEYLKDEIGRLERRLSTIEDSLAEINEKLSLVDYLADLVEKYVKHAGDRG